MAILASCDHLEASQSLMTDLPQHLKLIQKHVHYSSSLLRDLISSQNMDRPMIMTMGELHHFLESILPSLSLIMGNDAMVELGPVVTSPVQVNRNPLLRVLLQLVRNVAEAEISHPLAFVSVREVDDWCEISVSDNGPGLVGINPEDIFEPGVTTRGPQGARGYGLSAVARAVLDWGGEYGVENIDRGRGCRVWIRLPLARAITS
ncbi:MAG: ATP-binding protein [Candidatus Puniceispirillales bacterium]